MAWTGAGSLGPHWLRSPPTPGLPDLPQTSVRPASSCCSLAFIASVSSRPLLQRGMATPTQAPTKGERRLGRGRRGAPGSYCLRERIWGETNTGKGGAWGRGCPFLPWTEAPAVHSLEPLWACTPSPGGGVPSWDPRSASSIPRERMLRPVAMATGWLVLYSTAMVADAKRWDFEVEGQWVCSHRGSRPFRVPEVGKGKGSISLFFPTAALMVGVS